MRRMPLTSRRRRRGLATFASANQTHGDPAYTRFDNREATSCVTARCVASRFLFRLVLTGTFFRRGIFRSHLGAIGSGLFRFSSGDGVPCPLGPLLSSHIFGSTLAADASVLFSQLTQELAHLFGGFSFLRHVVPSYADFDLLYIFSLRSKTDLDIVVLSAVGFDKEQNRILGGKGYGSEYPRTAK